jgi:hypothetical protein
VGRGVVGLDKCWLPRGFISFLLSFVFPGKPQVLGWHFCGNPTVVGDAVTRTSCYEQEKGTQTSFTERSTSQKCCPGKTGKMKYLATPGPLQKFSWQNKQTTADK